MKRYFIGILLIAMQLSLLGGNYQGVKLLGQKLNATVEMLQAANTNKLKSVLADEKKLDSIVYDNGSSKLFFYNENGQITDFKSYVVDWDDEPAELKEHQYFEYDASGNNTLHILYYLDSFDGWIEKEKYEYKYDAAGNLIEEIYWDYSHNKMANPVSKNSYLYDGNNITVNNYTWIEADEDWMLTDYYTMETDGDGKILSGEGYTTSEDTGEMFKAVMMGYEYDAAGRQLSESTKMFYPEQDQWLDVMLSEYEYNDDGELILDRGKTFINGDVETWFGYEDRYVYEEGKLVRKEEYGKMGAGELYLAWYDEYIYDGDILSSKIQYFYEATSEEMKLQEKIDYSFISGEDADDYLLPEIDPYRDDNSVYSYEVSSFGVLGNLTRYNIPWDSEELMVDYEATYYYSGGGSSVVLSSDATLASVEMNGTSFTDFSGSVYSYDIELETGVTEVPDLLVETNDDAATYNITDASELPGVSVVEVIAEDGTIVNYEFNFSVKTSSEKMMAGCTEVYPIPFNNQLVIKSHASEMVSFALFSLTGQKLEEHCNLKTNERNIINTQEYKKGVYFLRVHTEKGDVFTKRVIKQ